MTLYTVQQVADKLSMKVRTIQRYIREGKIKAIKWTKGYRIDEASLNDFINKMKGE